MPIFAGLGSSTVNPEFLPFRTRQRLIRKLSNSIRTLPSPGRDSVWFGAFFTTTASIGTRTRPQRLKKQQIAQSHSHRNWAKHGWHREPTDIEFRTTFPARWKPIAKRKSVCPIAPWLMNTWFTWSAAWVTGEKLKLTFAELIELDPRNFRLWARTATDDIFADLRRFGEAHAAIDRALEISPNDQYAITVKALLFQYEGRLDEAAKQLARLPNDSTDKTILLVRATQALLERDFEQAIFCTEQVTRSISFDKPLSTQDTLGLVLPGYGQQWTGRSDEARATFGRMIQAMAPAADAAAGATYDARSLLALAYAGIGDKEKALEQANQAVADYDKDAVNKAVAEGYRAQIQARFGEIDAAIAAVAHLLQVPAGIHPGDLRYSPFWDPLRKDPRFEALVKNPPPVRY